jgi:hypothetical protein
MTAADFDEYVLHGIAGRLGVTEELSAAPQDHGSVAPVEGFDIEGHLVGPAVIGSA